MFVSDPILKYNIKTILSVQVCTLVPPLYHKVTFTASLPAKVSCWMKQ